MTCAAVTVALVLGATVERMKFSATMIFAISWLTIVYFPIEHMVWAGNGYFFALGALDLAGGTVVHINAGVSALVACLILGKRLGYKKEVLAPPRMMRTFIDHGLPLLGCFGFNISSGLPVGEEWVRTFKS